MKTVWWFLKKLKIELPNDPAFPLLSMYAKDLKARTQTDTCPSMITATLLTISKG